MHAALYDRWMATTLTSAAGKPEAVAGTMWIRLATAFEIMADMTGWPAGKVQGITA